MKRHAAIVGSAALLLCSARSAAQDHWRPISESDAPQARIYHSAVWTGTEMIVWGGMSYDYTLSSMAYLYSGGRYDPALDTWEGMSRPSSCCDPPVDGDVGGAAVWTGDEMLLWRVGRYDPASDTWAPFPDEIPCSAGIYFNTAVWTGSVMIVWGGGWSRTEDPTNEGCVFDPATDIWSRTSLVNAPEPRRGHTAVWTGTEMIVWGGDTRSSSLFYSTGGRYDPVTDTWRPTSTTDAPLGNAFHEAIWTGSDMIVWGGYTSYFDSGGTREGRYDPVTDTWEPFALPDGFLHWRRSSAVWTGREMVVWGGYSLSFGGFTATGWRYDPAAQTWTPTTTEQAPEGREAHSAIWTGSEMIIWGGVTGYWEIDTVIDVPLNSGGRYSPAHDNGDACVEQAQCSSGFCTDDVCCDAICDAPCEACDTAGATGRCVAVDAGSEGDPACFPYTCDASSPSCPQSCSVDADCAGSYLCHDGRCEAMRVTGDPCDDPRYCLSGWCVDGVCCSAACMGGCSRCDLSGSEGACAPVTKGDPGDGSCKPYLCTGDGADCPRSCDDDTGCVTGWACVGNACIEKDGAGVAPGDPVPGCSCDAATWPGGVWLLVLTLLSLWWRRAVLIAVRN